MTEFLGVWQLESFYMATKSGLVKFLPLGKNPHGSLIYTANGYMSVHLSKQKRKIFSSPYAVMGIGKKAEINDTVRNYVTYCGSYTIKNDTVVHKIESHLIPNEVGKEYIRHYKFENGKLILETVPMNIGVFSLVGTLTWTRYHEA